VQNVSLGGKMVFPEQFLKWMKKVDERLKRLEEESGKNDSDRIS